MFKTEFSDRDLETLLVGLSPDDERLEGLTEFVAALRSYQNVPYTSDATTNMAARLAATSLQSKSSALKSAPGDSTRRGQPRMRRRLVTAMAGAALLMAMSGVAIAADGAVPGSPLYGLDLALEKVGIGNGASNERIAEAEFLLTHDQEEAGFRLLGEAIDEATSNGDLEAADKVQRHLELAASKSNPNAAAAQEKVAELKAFIEANKGPAGLNGKEFGQGVAEIARNQPNPSKDQPKSEPPENAGPKPGKGNAPDHAGPKAKTSSG